MLVRPSCGLWLRCRESGGGEVLSRLWCRLQYKPLRVFWPCLCLRRYISQDRVSDVHCPTRQFWKSFASTSRYQNSSESVLLCSRLCQGRPTELWNGQNLLCVFRTLHFCFYIVKVKKKNPTQFCMLVPGLNLYYYACTDNLGQQLSSRSHDNHKITGWDFWST